MTGRDPQARYQLQGIAAALSELAGAHTEPDLALMVLDSLGLCIFDLEAAGADPLDLQPLKDAMNRSAVLVQRVRGNLAAKK